MGEKGEGSGGGGGGKWGERGRELGMGYPPVHPLDTIQFVNSKGADQTARMRKLVCAFVVCRPRWQNSSRTFNNLE